MGNIAILAGGDSTLLPRDHDAYVGVDGGCLKLLGQGLPLDMAVGDFDSVSETDLNNIKAQAKWCNLFLKRTIQIWSWP